MLDDITQLKQQIIDEIDVLTTKMLRTGNNAALTANQYKSRISFLQWVNKNWKLRSNDIPKVVKQREIFFCNLGSNIGSEQNGKRPVIIMQNNIGNSMGDTTVIVPVTTYDNSTFFSKDGKRYMSYLLPNGSTKNRELDFYEIEIQIEDNAKYSVHGVANVVHMREISKRRLAKTPVAIITKNTYDNIIEAINKNLSII